jgi:hypothetical protein
MATTESEPEGEADRDRVRDLEPGATMSADNWRDCPKCLAKAKADKVKREEAAEQAYGKVPKEEYLALLAEAGKPVEVEDTMREDYELGIDQNGKFYVIYRADCQDCPFVFTYRHEEIVK